MNNSNISFQHNDGGARAAGFKTTGDCVVRAIAILVFNGTGEGYREVRTTLRRMHREAVSKGFRMSRGTERCLIPKLTKHFGLVKFKVDRTDGWPTLASAHAQAGDCICVTTKHWMAITGGALRDTADCRTYWWQDEWGHEYPCDRKAGTIWVRA